MHACKMDCVVIFFFSESGHAIWGYISVIIMEGVVILWEGYPTYLGVVI